ncbi:MAG: hypothetical protein ABIG63_19110, partial [Chloroflexota bacterium]
WSDLQELLETVADSRTADLFRLRERREELAQIASAKLETMLALLAPDGGEAGQNLVYDPGGLWSPNLQKALSERGLKVETGAATTTTNDEWENLWRRFEAGKVNVLLFSTVPPFGLPRANIDRLIVTTPVMSLATLAAATDWALTHANPFIRHHVEIHLLYVPQTPEEQAMLDFADTVCGLRFPQ